MKITNLGGATAIVEHRGKRMLFDPWLDDGIFHGSWFHWPPVTVKPADLGHIDYVYISHIHEDHCSAGTIRHINRDAEIIIMDRQPNFVANFLRANGFDFAKVHLIPPRHGKQITEDLFVDMVEADPANEMAFMIDSSLVLRWGARTLFNANDCQPHEGGLRYLRDTYPKIDLALLPYSGGSGYPSCYVNLSDAEKLAERDRIVSQRVAGFVRNVQTLMPARVLPFADQYVVGGSRKRLNRYVSHSSSPGVVRPCMEAAGLSDRLLLLNPGQAFDLEDGMLEPPLPFQEVSEQDRSSYIDLHLASHLYDHEKVTFNPTVPIDRLVAYARSRLWRVQVQRQAFPQHRLLIGFDTTRRLFEIDLAKEEARELKEDEFLVEPYLKVSGSDTLMTMILIGHISWNIADAALFLDYERCPNHYDPGVYVLLNFLRI